MYVNKRKVDLQEAIELKKIKLSAKMHSRLIEHFKIMNRKMKDGQREGVLEAERIEKRLSVDAESQRA